jgi:hypothetical protein
MIMEKNSTYGIYFAWKDIEEIIEQHLNWVEVCEEQVFCVPKVLSDDTPVGTSIVCRVDGIKCEENSDTLMLSLSNGIYTLPVKTTRPNDVLDYRFGSTVSVPATYGCIVDGVLDILTDEEKAFKQVVDEHLGYRDDIYANEFRKINIRNIGGRGLLLLEKIKAEIQDNQILVDDAVTPTQLVTTFIEMTNRYVESCKSIGDLQAKHDDLWAQYKDTFEEGSRHTKKLARDIEIINRKIESNRDIADYCLATIEAAIMPVLTMDVGR